MKKTILSMAFVGLSLMSIAQTKEKSLSQAEQFSSQAGVLIEKQFITIGTFKGVEIKVLSYKDLNSGAAKSCVRIEYDVKTSYGSDTKIAVLDADELDGLIKSLKNMQTTVFPSTRDIYTEITFKSRTGFEAGAFFTLKDQKWNAYIQIDKYDNKSMVFLTVDDFASFLSLIEQAKAKL